jgi:hypothetical protein
VAAGSAETCAVPDTTSNRASNGFRPVLGGVWFIVRLKRRDRLFHKVQRHTAGTVAIRSASTDQGRVRIMAVWRSGSLID